MGDVVMTTEAPLGNVAQIPDERRYILSQRVILLRGKQGIVSNGFLRYFLSSQICNRMMAAQSSGTTATGIQRRKFEQLPLPIPSPAEQDCISFILAAADSDMKVQTRLLEKLRRIKSGLMQDLLAGKCRVTNLLKGEESS